jgi:hypothetical protein
LPHSTFCLHSDVFRIATRLLSTTLTTMTDHPDTERLLKAAR